MTPKEKALELCNKFMICNSYQAIVWYNAKQCALIAVDYIRYSCEWNQHLYWLEVKQEIEKL
jgi:hypothetical protein